MVYRIGLQSGNCRSVVCEFRLFDSAFMQELELTKSDVEEELRKIRNKLMQEDVVRQKADADRMRNLVWQTITQHREISSKSREFALET